MAKYRVVHFLPDPFSGARVPVAALVAEGAGISIAKAAGLPGGAYLGSPRSELALRLVLDSLAETKSFDHLPISVGPQASLGPVRDVPAGVPSVTDWVRRHVLHEPETLIPAPPQAAKRQTSGFQFFQRWGVGTSVRKWFRPEEGWSSLTSGSSISLDPVSHWVGDPASELLLMEPIVPAQPQHLKSVREVFGRFAGYQVFLRAAGADALKQHTQFCVYVLPGGTSESRVLIRDAFSPLHARIVDTDDDRQRDELLGLVRALGQSRAGQTPPPSSGAN